jgi:ankyrin repeat protein
LKVAAAPVAACWLQCVPASTCSAGGIGYRAHLAHLAFLSLQLSTARSKPLNLACPPSCPPAQHLRRSAVDEEAADAGGDGVSWSSAQQAALDDQLLQQQHVPAADAPSDGRYCDLMWKAVAFHDDAQLQRLVASGADINDEMPGLGLTPLQYCAAQGSNIKAVIAAGALLDDQNEKGLTALMLATRDNKVHAARALLEAGASVSLADNKGWTVLHWAASTAWYGLNVKELIEAGADIAATSHTGDTPLHEAVRRKAWHTAAMLVAAGASVDQTNDSQQSPLDLAAGCPQMVKLLQAKSAGELELERDLASHSR